MSGRGMPRPGKRLTALRAKNQSGEIDQSLEPLNAALSRRLPL
jgi:hypothetical protein